MSKAAAAACLAFSVPAFAGDAPPFGHLEVVVPAGGSASVARGQPLIVIGWVADDLPGVKVRVLLDGVLQAAVAPSIDRPDVAAYFGNGAILQSGWRTAIATAALSEGPHELQAVAIDSNGASTALGTNTVIIGPSRFIGRFDYAVSYRSAALYANHLVVFGGWAADTAGSGPVPLSVQIDGVPFANAQSGDPRPDVAARFGRADFGASGWHLEKNLGAIAPGAHTATVVASTGVVLGTLSFTVSAGTADDERPFGYVDELRDLTSDGAQVAQQDHLRLFGWAVDSDDGSPIDVAAYLDGVYLGPAHAGEPRPDVADFFADARFASSGWTFDTDLGALPPGAHQIEFGAVDGAGHAVSIGAKAFTSTAPDGAPFGNVNSFTPALTTFDVASLAGWAADPGSDQVAAVEIFIDGASAGLAALDAAAGPVPAFNGRTDYPNNRWSFTTAAPLPVGSHDVRAVATGATGLTTLLRAVTIRVEARFSNGVIAASRHPLVARYTRTLADGERFSVEFGPSNSYGLRTWAVNAPAGGGEVSLLVAGMKSASTYHLRGVVDAADGSRTYDPDTAFQTGVLGPIPAITVTRPGEANPGVELLSGFNAPVGTLATLVLDLDGNAIWSYVDPGVTFTLARQRRNGDFLLVAAGFLREVDLEGNTVWQLGIPELSARLAANGFQPVAGTFHHDVIELPNGHLAALVNTVRTVGSSNGVIVDSIVELDDALQPVWVWSGADHLDIDDHQPWGLPDWTHCNALEYSAVDGSLVLSVRHLNEVIKIDFANGAGAGDILWRLGHGRDFTLTNGGDAGWFYAQHDARVIGGDASHPLISLWDNGDYRLPEGVCGNPGPDGCFSRALILSLDVGAHTASIDWAHTAPVYAPFIGSNTVLPNGNIEYDAGTVNSAKQAIVQEVTRAGAVAWQLEVANANLYRSVRQPSLYPGVQW